MSFNFVEKVMTIGGTGNEVPTLQFYKKGFVIGGGKVTPDWRDIILSGNTALTLVNSKANSLNYLKLFGATEQVPQEYIDGLTLEGKCEQRDILPSEYQRVEYLESTGTQYIDTGYKSSNNTKVKAQISCPDFNTFIFGSRNNITGDTQKRFGLFFNIRWNPQYANQNGSGSETSVNTIYNIEMSQDGFYANGDLDTSFTSNTFSSDYNMYLFANNTADTSIGYGSCKIYSFEIYTNNVLVHKYIPAKNSSNVLGMYDTVSGTFFTNAGTGTFTAGADVTVPSPNTPIDIVCNNGVVKVSPNLYNLATRTDGYYIGADGTIAQGSRTFCYSALIPVKPNTNYMLSGTAGQTDNRRLHAYDSSGNWISQVSSANTTVGNTYNITGTTPNNCAYVRISIPMLDTNVQVEQGSTATSYMAYGQIYTDGTQENVEIHSKNLFDVSTLNIGYNFNDSGAENTSSYGATSGYIKVTGGATYTMSFSQNDDDTIYRLIGYDNNQTLLSNPLLAKGTRTPLGTQTYTTTIPNDCAYVRFSVEKNATNIMFEQGSTATTYEPYFNGGSATAENLFKVGTYQDVQEILTGGVTRNVGIKVLDGTEEWTAGSTAGNYILTNVENAVLPNTCICSHFVGVPSNYDISQGDKIIRYGYISASLNYPNRLYIRDTSVNNVTGLKQYLADQYANGTPVIIVYPISSPTTETVTGQPLSIQAGTNIVEITQASMDDLELEVSYKAGVSVTITEIQNAQLDNNVEVTING